MKDHDDWSKSGRGTSRQREGEEAPEVTSTACPSRGEVGSRGAASESSRRSLVTGPLLRTARRQRQNEEDRRPALLRLR